MLKARLVINGCRSDTNYTQHKRKITVNQDINAKELDAEKKAQERVTKRLDQKEEIPLFLRAESQGQKGNPQDEKDKSGE